METTLKEIAGDRLQSPQDRALARDMLALLPILLKLREQGFGELVAKFQDGRVIGGEATWKWQTKGEN